LFILDKATKVSVLQHYSRKMMEISLFSQGQMQSWTPPKCCT